MESFTKELTVIDFIGILLPGCYLVLLWSGEISLSVIWTGYFGDECGEITKAAFLIICGYIVGSLIHQLAGMIERLVWHIPRIQKFDPQQRALENGREIDTAAGSTNTASMAQVLTTVMGKRSYQKRHLFEGFHVMMRNMALVYIGSLIWNLFAQFRIYKTIWDAMNIANGMKILIVFSLGALMITRAYYYRYLYYKYAVEDYYFLQKEKNQKSLCVCCCCRNASGGEGKIP